MVDDPWFQAGDCCGFGAAVSTGAGTNRWDCERGGRSAAVQVLMCFAVVRPVTVVPSEPDGGPFGLYVVNWGRPGVVPGGQVGMAAGRGPTADYTCWYGVWPLCASVRWACFRPVAAPWLGFARPGWAWALVGDSPLGSDLVRGAARSAC